MVLSELVFSDLCVADTATASWYKATPDSLITEQIPRDCEQELFQLRDKLMSCGGKSNFRVEWPDKNGLGMRVERLTVSDSKVVFICRRYRLMPGSLASLGMPPIVANQLLNAELTEGLVVFLGKAGSGKTTTAASFCVERLTRFGGVCWTVENPIELPMQGRHGPGVCYQTEIDSDDGIGPAICKLYRATPNIIMVGEARDGQAVREGIAAATSGHLVVMTFHAADLITGLARLSRLAGDDNANVALSDALRVGIHLELHNADTTKRLPGNAFSILDAKGTGTPPRVLGVEPLWVKGTGATDALKAIMRDGDFHLLKSEIDRQRRQFMMSKLPGA